MNKELTKEEELEAIFHKLSLNICEGGHQYIFDEMKNTLAPNATNKEKTLMLIDLLDHYLVKPFYTLEFSYKTMTSFENAPKQLQIGELLVDQDYIDTNKPQVEKLNEELFELKKYLKSFKCQ